MTTFEPPANPADSCPRCDHPVDPHVFVTTGDGPQQGGMGFCPEPGCPCTFTWSANGVPASAVRVPGQDEMDELRHWVQYERS